MFKVFFCLCRKINFSFLKICESRINPFNFQEIEKFLPWKKFQRRCNINFSCIYIYINRNFNLIVAPGTPDFQALINFSSIKKFQSAFNPDPNYRKTTTFAMMIKIKIIQKLEDQLSHYLGEN